MTLTDEVPDELIQKMHKMGIDTKKISFKKKDPGEKATTRTFQVDAGAIKGEHVKVEDIKSAKK